MFNKGRYIQLIQTTAWNIMAQTCWLFTRHFSFPSRYTIRPWSVSLYAIRYYLMIKFWPSSFEYEYCITFPELNHGCLCLLPTSFSPSLLALHRQSQNSWESGIKHGRSSLCRPLKDWVGRSGALNLCSQPFLLQMNEKPTFIALSHKDFQIHLLDQLRFP